MVLGVGSADVGFRQAGLVTRGANETEVDDELVEGRGP